jgi:hypothetical protein
VTLSFTFVKTSRPATHPWRRPSTMFWAIGAHPRTFLKVSNCRIQYEPTEAAIRSRPGLGNTFLWFGDTSRQDRVLVTSRYSYHLQTTLLAITWGTVA